MTIRDLINSIINILNSILDIKIESVLGVLFCIGGILLGGYLSRLYFQHYDAAESETKEIKESLITFLSNDYYNQEALLDFKDFTQKLDLIRRTSLKDVNPELYNWCF